MMKIITWIAVCFPIGAVVTAFIMWWAYKEMCDKYGSPSEYYFNLPKKPILPIHIDNLDKVLNRICLFLFLFSAYLIFLIPFLLNDPSEKTLSFIETLTTNMQTGLNLLIPVCCGIVGLFVTLKKPYYVLFTTSDVMSKYGIYPYMCFVFLTWIICLISMSIGNAGLWFFSYGGLLLFQPIGYVLCATLFFKSSRIIFSNDLYELKILDVLYTKFNTLFSLLPHINIENISYLDSISNYLISLLIQRSEKADNKLKKYISLSTVEFCDAANDAPFPAKAQGLFPMVYFTALSFLMGLGIRSILSYIPWVQQQLTPFIQQNRLFVIIFSTIILYPILLLFVDFQPLRHMRYSVVYGQLGYRFLDENGRPQHYIPRYPLRANKAVKWFRALLNILTLCRIECANKCSEGLLRKLNDMFTEFQSHERENVETFTFALAYYLCLKLAQEMELTVEYQSEIDRVLHKISHKELLISWADAIWVDMKRDMDWYRKNYGSAEPVTVSKP